MRNGYAKRYLCSMIRRLAVFGFAGIIVAAAAMYAAMGYGIIPANADAVPSTIEAAIAQRVLAATVQREASQISNPLPPTEQTVIAGIQVYRANCELCHGAANGKPSAVALGLYQKPPQIAGGCMADDPENQTFWKIKHGIRFTGMPSFSATLSDTQIWQVAAFLKHIDHLPPAAAKRWRVVPVLAQTSSASRLNTENRNQSEGMSTMEPASAIHK